MLWLSGTKWFSSACAVVDAIMIALNLGLVIFGLHHR